jgi:hypothetical protein
VAVRVTPRQQRTDDGRRTTDDGLTDNGGSGFVVELRRGLHPP